MEHETRTLYYDDPVELGTLTRRLRQRITAPLLDYVPGKTQIRDAIIAELSCSAVRAESLVERLEERGFIHFGGDSDRVEMTPGVWVLDPDPGSINTS